MSTLDIPDSHGLGPRIHEHTDPNRSPRTWALVGMAAGLAGIVGIQASMTVDAVYVQDGVADAASITARLAEQRTNMLVEHTALILSSLLLLVFAAGLRRHLSRGVSPDSLVPWVAAGGVMLTSVACLLGSGFTTEIVFGLGDTDLIVPEFAVMVGHWMGTIPWLWVGVGVSGIAVAVASLKHHATPRWIGWTSAVLGGITTLFGISPLQYMAGFTGPVWVLVVSIGFFFGARRTEQA
ncbi:hypothetical protein [Rhodococcus sp. KRD197]|jgi:hypothetical protein|uniref:hypothetical protein n=1 Tax=unclassified Rhodococcus (in: high G+C Gram-positive bacteria) TaxID=192944 RepID=UPI001F49F12A|nr:hypothetical protein [Rhodococcus sp. KRD197]